MKALKTNLLASCAPSPELSEFTQSSIIRRSARDMAFTLIGEGIELSCLIESTKDRNGNFAGEIYFPVIGELQASIGLPIRSVKFHPALGQNNQHFIFPQKLPTATRPNCTWALSLAEALDHPFGTWLNITSYKKEGLYHCEVLDLPGVKSLEWPEFEQVLEAAFVGKIIDNIDHPIIERLRGNTSPKNSFESFSYEV